MRSDSFDMPGLVQMLLFALVCTNLAVGCDRVRIESEPASRPDPQLQSGALRSRLTPQGLAALFDVTHPEGLALESESRTHSLDEREVSVGPLDQPLSIDDIDVEIDAPRVDVTISDRGTTVIVPVRLRRRTGDRICRFRLDTGPWSLEIAARDDSAPEWRFETAEPPDFTANQLQIGPVGQCPPLLDDEEQLPANLATILSEYLDRAVQSAAREFIDVPVYETLGLLRGHTRLHGLSPFPNRQGTIDLVGEPPDGSGISLDAYGLTTALEIGASSRRASCTRPDDLDGPTSSRPAQEVDREDFRGSEATFGLALAKPALDRLLRAITLGGFVCRGLERSGAGREADPIITRQDASLEDIGLDSVPLEGPLRRSIAPNGLPDLALQSDSNSVELTWPGLSVALYGTYAGARVTLLRTAATVDFTLVPAGGLSGAIRFDVNAIRVDDVDFESPWSTDSPDAEPLRRWTQRLFLAIFEDSFRLPLPLRPDAPLELRQTRVRSDDLLLLMQLRSGGGGKLTNP